MSGVSKASKRIYKKPLPLSARIRYNSIATATPLSKAKRYAIQEQSRMKEAQNNAIAQAPPYTPFRSKAERRKNAMANEDDYDYPSLLSDLQTSSTTTTRQLVF